MKETIRPSHHRAPSGVHGSLIHKSHSFVVALHTSRQLNETPAPVWLLAYISGVDPTSLLPIQTVFEVETCSRQQTPAARQSFDERGAWGDWANGFMRSSKMAAVVRSGSSNVGSTFYVLLGLIVKSLDGLERASYCTQLPMHSDALGLASQRL
ncbi:hypothetical protein K437DRAFT_120157 [Tilletiaria anomala UBC 951]|uniref:Uncharacterized protein n=1 Tax=Tilletiaria anomala (strain ATCC 24038 / CBS 436.72 / UBC 951) TaxID=1037660 RepID=A0A066W468_TILAU|nr:uncharacterized protein K437DRAFT_120157 [Tilletiaria anomala UBC 951]KDN45585.1 hypothetical protein K437DRAFT_120157 [Tilletiaria anomala UBC 951]